MNEMSKNDNEHRLQHRQNVKLFDNINININVNEVPQGTLNIAFFGYLVDNGFSYLDYLLS